MTSAIPLSAEAVHLWRAYVADRDGDDAHALDVLSPLELQRAADFRLDADRWRFIRRRAILREILSFYTGIQPSRLVIETPCLHCYDRTHGKPQLIITDDSSKLTFSASSAGNLAVYAIARGRPVGIDVEAVNWAVNVEQIAGAMMSEQEITELQSLAPSLRTEAALCAWTQKEAYLKGTGHGLVRDPRRIRVSIDPKVPTSVVEPLTGDEWRSQCFLPAEGYLGAVAVPLPVKVSMLGWQLDEVSGSSL